MVTVSNRIHVHYIYPKIKRGYTSSGCHPEDEISIRRPPWDRRMPFFIELARFEIIFGRESSICFSAGL